MTAITFGPYKATVVQIHDGDTIDVDIVLIPRAGDIDPGMYPVFENYRAYDTSLPTNDVYYGGLIRGVSQAEVTVP